MSNNYNKIELKIYKIELNNLYNFTIFREIKTIIYNNYLTLSSSVCNIESCDTYFSILIIFGYINNTDSLTDVCIDIFPFLNNNKTNNLINTLQENAIINNNIFGYEFNKEIKLVSIPDELIFYNYNNSNNSIQQEQKEKIKLVNGNILFYEHEIDINESKLINNSTFLEYQLIAHELNIENNYYELIINDSYYDEIDDNFDFENKLNIFYGKLSQIKFKLYDNCENNSKYYVIKDNNKKICLNNNYNCPLNYPYLNIETNECLKKLPNETDILSNTIQTNIYHNNVTSLIEIEETIIDINQNDLTTFVGIEKSIIDINHNNITSIIEMEKTIIDLNQNHILSFNEIKESLINNYNGLDNIIIISDNNNIYQITNSLNENNIKKNDTIKNYNMSIIELGKCENLLKEKNDINENIPLILFKLERNDYINNSSKKNVYYEVINPKTKKKLDLSICDKEKIIINMPTSLSNYTLELYKNLSELGYDIFDKNDIFYNDICTIFTSNFKTDILLSDRRKDYYNESEVYCQDGCQYEDFDINKKMVKCLCDPINALIENITIIGFNNSDLSSFFEIKTYANIEVIKCYNLLFCLKGIINNIGFYIIAPIIFIFVIDMLIYYINYNSNISFLISIISPKKKKMKMKKSNYPPIKRKFKKKLKIKKRKKTYYIRRKKIILVFNVLNHYYLQKKNKANI